jgi:hypothetical protein
MKRLLLIGLLAVAVGSTYSSVYACDHSRKNLDTTATALPSKTIRTIVVNTTTGCRTAEKASVVTFDFDVQAKDAHRVIRVIECEKAHMESPSPLRTAMTLGRAFMTTIGAVMTSLLDAASEATASLV